jgi:hypothetical protein
MNEEKKMAARGERAGWRGLWYLITLCALIAGLIMSATNLGWINGFNNNLKIAAACKVRESGYHCFTGNACVAGLLTPNCHSDNGECDQYECQYRPLPDGACCDHYDFCSTPDPLKTCQAGVCLSPNVSACRGYCNVDADCNGTYKPPVFPAVASVEAFCINHACLTVAQSFTPFINCSDLLNQTTFQQRQIGACLQSYRFSYTTAPPAYFGTCYFNYACSQALEFSAPLPPSFKRAMEGEVFVEEERNWSAMRHPVPGSYTPWEYLNLNEEIEARIKSRWPEHS